MDGIKLDWNLFTGLGYISLIYFRSVSLYERQVIIDLPLIVKLSAFLLQGTLRSEEAPGPLELLAGRVQHHRHHQNLAGIPHWVGPAWALPHSL